MEPSPSFLLNELKDKPFVLQEVTQLIQKKPKTLQEGPLTVHFFKVTKKEMRPYLHRAHLLHTYLQIKKPLTFWIIPTSSPRLFPTPNQPVTQENINGGYTYINGNTIYIYRHEDYPKVMLHEIIHHSAIHSNSIYNEAIVEFWALLFHLLFISTPTPATFDTLYQKELQWSLSLCKKLSQHPADTSYATHYIIIKTCLLFFRQEFLQLPPTASIQTHFIDTHKKHPAFLKAIQAAPLPTNNSMRMVQHGNQ
jgi:hypothetical protein